MKHSSRSDIDLRMSDLFFNYWHQNVSDFWCDCYHRRLFANERDALIEDANEFLKSFPEVAAVYGDPTPEELVSDYFSRLF